MGSSRVVATMRSQSTFGSAFNCETTPFPGKPDATRICVKGGFNPALLYNAHAWPQWDVWVAATYALAALVMAMIPAALGIGLAEMTQLGVPVPAGFTITTDACRAYMSNGKTLPDGVEEEIERHLAVLEEKTGKRFGDTKDPLLVSVRSGARDSMPGMMDTILNLGLTSAAVKGLAGVSGEQRLVLIERGTRVECSTRSARRSASSVTSRRDTVSRRATSWWFRRAGIRCPMS